MEEEVIDLEQYNYKTKFVERFKMWQLDDLEFKVLRIEDLPPAYGLHFEEYEVNFEIRGLRFSIQIISSKYEKEKIIRKLSINIREEEYRNELTSCVNYLQRRRDLSYAIECLHNYAILREQREVIGLYLLQEIEDYLSVRYVPDEGFMLTCQDSRNDRFLFEAHWKVWWNCRNFQFFDYIKFSLTRENNDFHRTCKNIMTDLTKPTTVFLEKKSNWLRIVQCVRKFINDQEPIIVENNNREIINAPIEISDSDSESEDDICVVYKSDGLVID